MKRLVVALFLGIAAFLIRLLRRAFSDEGPGAPSAAPSVGRGGEAVPEAVSASAAPAAVGISPMDTPESSEPMTVRSAATADTEAAGDAAGPSAAAAGADGAPNADDDAASADAASADAAGTLATAAGAEARAPITGAPAFAATPEAGGGAARGNYATPEATVTRVSRPAPASAVLATADAGAAGGMAGTAGGDAGTATGTGPTATGGDVAETDLALPAGAVRGDGGRECPADYPIKGNAGSMIYHSPGSGSYAATIAEFCFGSADEAEAAGFRAPRRG